MSRQSIAEKPYSLKCKVLGEKVKTNPKQAAVLIKRYDITMDELINSYVSRNGRKKIAKEKLTPEEASELYGLHINVAKSLKCTVKSSSQPVEP